MKIGKCYEMKRFIGISKKTSDMPPVGVLGMGRAPMQQHLNEVAANIGGGYIVSGLGF
ncbi:MAG: hypothetical protein CLLPBCKN_006448 [Chroococcidiopsis cubana SAG 39.79]|nr:hypothetical protein [Chroococcidiopsis cubana SAG 39.79]